MPGRGLERDRVVVTAAVKESEVAARKADPMEGGEEADRRNARAHEQPNSRDVESRACRIRCQTNAALIHRGTSQQARTSAGAPHPFG